MLRKTLELSRTAESGLFIIEVFPGSGALSAFDVKFYGRCKAPKYRSPPDRGKVSPT